MTTRIITTLATMRAGESGIVCGIEGGFGLVNRLAALGIRPGKKITKISSIFRRGPVTVQVDRMGQIALGFGMANRVLVETAEDTH